MNRLENYRLRSGLTQAELAEKAGLDRSRLCRAEKGGYDFKGQIWVILARVLGCTVDELLGSTNE